MKHFDLDGKHDKPSKQTILAVINMVNKFLKTGHNAGSGWMYLALIDRSHHGQVHLCVVALTHFPN